MSKLSEYVTILDNQRIPLSEKERSKLKKIYPYYGAQGIVDYVDNYLFNGDYILVAEDGNNLKTLNENIATWASGKFWVNNHAHILGKKEGTCLKYIYYLINVLDLRGYITGSAQPKLNQENLANIDIKVPDYAIQIKIANILSLLDKKIEVNNRINDNLSELIRDIYNYWFYQYEFPNRDGKPYKSCKNRMVYSNALKKDIPENWNVKKLKDCILHINTGLNPRDNFKLGNGNIRYITVKNLSSNGTVDFENCDVIDDEARSIVHSRSQVSKGDVLFASIAPLGRCCIVNDDPTDWDINESVFSIRPNTSLITSEYLYLYLTSDDFVKKAEHSATGSVFSGIRISTLEDMYITVPDFDTLTQFSSKTDALFTMRAKLSAENEKLKQLRDFLLPLLMNGQIAIE